MVLFSVDRAILHTLNSSPKLRAHLSMSKWIRPKFDTLTAPYLFWEEKIGAVLSSFRIFIRKRPSPYTGYRQSDPTEAAATPEILLILSDDWEKIKDILKRRGGLLLQADAGCGSVKLGLLKI